MASENHRNDSSVGEHLWKACGLANNGFTNHATYLFVPYVYTYM